MKIDAIDQRIIMALQRNGTLGQNQLADIAGASPASCWRRVKALEAEGILGDVVRLVPPDAIGMTVHVFCHIRLKNHQPETTTQFEELLDRHDEIMECYAMSGDWDYLLRIISRDVASYEYFLRNSLLRNSAVSAASSAFALSQRKYTTALPVRTATKE